MSQQLGLGYLALGTNRVQSMSVKVGTNCTLTVLDLGAHWLGCFSQVHLRPQISVAKLRRVIRPRIPVGLPMHGGSLRAKAATHCTAALNPDRTEDGRSAAEQRWRRGRLPSGRDPFSA